MEKKAARVRRREKTAGREGGEVSWISGAVLQRDTSAFWAQRQRAAQQTQSHPQSFAGETDVFKRDGASNVLSHATKTVKGFEPSERSANRRVTKSSLNTQEQTHKTGSIKQIRSDGSLKLSTEELQILGVPWNPRGCWCNYSSFFVALRGFFHIKDAVEKSLFGCLTGIHWFKQSNYNATIHFAVQ